MLAVHDGAGAIEFYKKAFGAKELYRYDDNGKVGHAELTIGEAPIYIADEYEGHNRSPRQLGGSSVILQIYVEDVDAFVVQSAKAGARVISAPEDQPYGARSAKLEDPYGHVWMCATHIEEVSPEEFEARMAANV
jgi:PhnB protein